MKARRQYCTGTKSDRSGPCRRWAMRGQMVCWSHGGASPQAKRSASERLAAMVDPALVNLEAALQKAATRGAELSTPALRACQMILDRAGFPPGVEVRVEDNRESRAWLSYTNASERKTLVQIMERATARMNGEAESGNGKVGKVFSPSPPEKVSKPEPEVFYL